MHRMRRFAVLAGLALSVLPLVGQSASAALIRPSAGRAYPDIAADINGVVSYAYNASTQTGNFHMTNTPYLIAGGSTAAQEYAITPDSDGIRQQIINVTLDKNGNLMAGSSNTYALYGTVVADGQTYSGELLTGTPTKFGSQDLGAVGIEGSDAFDLDIKITGGLLSQFFGDEAYMRLTPELQSTFVGKFDQDFSAAKATSNTRSYNSPQPFPVPEPTTLLVLLAGSGVGLMHRRRMRAAR